MSKHREYRKVKNFNVLSQPVLPGIWQRKEGGYVVRAKARDASTGRYIEICKLLPNADVKAAITFLDEEKKRIQEGRVAAKKPSVRFTEFAEDLFKRKVQLGHIKSAASRNKWTYTLQRFEHAFGAVFIDKLHRGHIERWLLEVAAEVQAGTYKPSTVNSWLRVLRVITKAARREYELTRDAMEGIDNLDTSEHATYTEEEPNALEPHEVGPFLARFREWHPRLYAMVYLMLVTGLRPSSIRPLRRRGGEADVQWETGRLYVRRSHSVGVEIMKTTKQKRRYAIDLPREVMNVLRWHVDTQLTTPEQQESELLFPATTGGFRTPCVLNKPIDEVARSVGLTKHISQRALRRTFNDLAREAQINDLVTRSISGHQTSEMQRHYSTVNPTEQREALAKVIHLVEPPKAHRFEHVRLLAANDTTTPTNIENDNDSPPDSGGGIIGGIKP